MIDDITKYIEFLNELHINPNQYLLLWLIHHQDQEAVNLIRYNEGNSKLSYTELIELTDLGFIKRIRNISPGEKYYIDDYEICNKRIEEAFTNLSENRGLEFFMAYPDFMWIKGQQSPLKACDKEAVIKMYNSKVKTDKLHKAIIEALVDNPEPQMGIAKFILSEHWNILLKQVPNTPSYGTTAL